MFHRPKKPIDDFALEKPKSKKISRSKEEGDKPTLHDAMFNFVLGSCFEIGSSLSLLDSPEKAGVIVDGYSLQLIDCLSQVYRSSLGEQKITSPAGQEIILQEYFNQKILKELIPTSDQIGRCLDNDKKKIENWYKGEGLTWLVQQLRTSSSSKEYDYKNMLTKIRALSAFGTILRELIPKNVNIIVNIINNGNNDGTINKRNLEITTQIRHQKFDDPATRARTEKTPRIPKKAGEPEAPLSAYHEFLDMKLVDAGPVGLGFGNIWHTSGLAPKKNSPSKETAESLIKQFQEIESTMGRQGMHRQGQDLESHERPGLLGKSGIELIPETFKEIKLEEELKSHYFVHGSGINRWQLYGSYPIGSWDLDFPAAGAHSGGTSDILLALNCLSKTSILGDAEKVLPVGLLISAFMNFGGYHSFVETYPIIQAAANNTPFEVAVTEKQKHLYSQMLAVAKEYSSDGSKKMEAFLKAYRKALAGLMTAPNDAQFSDSASPLAKKK